MGNFTPALSFLGVLSCSVEGGQLPGMIHDQQQGHLFFIEAGSPQAHNDFFRYAEELNKQLIGDSLGGFRLGKSGLYSL